MKLPDISQGPQEALGEKRMMNYWETMNLTKLRFAFFFEIELVMYLFTVTCMPGRVPGSANMKWHHRWSLPQGDKQMGKQNTRPRETHWMGEQQGCGSREKGIIGGFLEVVTLRLGLDERVVGSQEEKARKGVLGNSFGEVTGLRERGTDSTSAVFACTGNKVW